MASQYGVSQFKLVAEIEGDEYEMVQFQMSFGLNMVPRASALMAVGRNARNITETATIHRTGDKLVYLKPAKVYFEAVGRLSAKDESWPSGRTLIFDGYLTGVSYRRSSNSVQLTLDFIHWLADLQFSSCISEISHPDNPYSYTYRAAKTLAGAGGAQPTWLGQYVGSDFFTLDKVTGDLWGQALQPFYCALAEEDLFKATGADRVETCVTLEEKVNRQALAALKRMVGGGCSEVQSTYYKPLTLRPGALGEELGEAICRGIQDTIADADFFQSFWDNLTVKLGPEFCFSLVPQIDKAFIAPVIPGLRETYTREIYATDQEYVDFQASLPRPLRAVVLYNTFYMETQTGLAQEDTEPNYDTGPGGCFAPAGDAEAKGQILVKRAPKWMTNIAATTEIAGATKSVYTKSTTTPEGSGPRAEKSPAAAIKDTKSLADWYCHYVYMCEALRGRSGTVAGKFRLDIAPGTTVKVHGSPEQFLGGEDTLGINMVGLVHTVTCALDAEQSKAGTGFGLTHLRTEFENQDDKTSIPIHPLYNQSYTGAPLTDSQAIT